MNNTSNQESHYEKLYSSNLEDIEKNLDNFIKQKEKDFLNQHNEEKIRG